MKVGSGEVAGLVNALRRFTAGDDSEDAQECGQRLNQIAEPLIDVQGLNLHIHYSARQPIPQIWLELNEATLGFSAYEAVARLLSVNPRVAVGEQQAELGIIAVNPLVLSQSDADVVRQQLVQLFKSSRQ